MNQQEPWEVEFDESLTVVSDGYRIWKKERGQFPTGRMEDDSIFFVRNFISATLAAQKEEIRKRVEGMKPTSARWNDINDPTHVFEDFRDTTIENTIEDVLKILE